MSILSFPVPFTFDMHQGGRDGSRVHGAPPNGRPHHDNYYNNHNNQGSYQPQVHYDQQHQRYAQHQQGQQYQYNNQHANGSGFSTQMMSNRGPAEQTLPPLHSPHATHNQHYPPLPNQSHHGMFQQQQLHTGQPHNNQVRPHPQHQQQSRSSMQPVLQQPQQPRPEQLIHQQSANSSRDHNVTTNAKPSFSAFEMDFPQWQKAGDEQGSDARQVILRTHLLLTGDDSRRRVAFCKYNPLHVLDHTEIQLHESGCVDRKICEALMNM
ncbi:hypothetical protein PFISCL1PPCAC_4002 [Pristionchus fissidentatus]|uniref:Uncharacterized protein n=1 Tax=Pristionchus fissidentatus TaxID=1538716 RepID=A0AAV5V4C3_9BILA|nr:hypothetical protein PFISCL1PPCAC_4002 [Pristionchus fissidentatus]